MRITNRLTNGQGIPDDDAGNYVPSDSGVVLEPDANEECAPEMIDVYDRPANECRLHVTRNCGSKTYFATITCLEDDQPRSIVAGCYVNGILSGSYHVLGDCSCTDLQKTVDIAFADCGFH